MTATSTDRRYDPDQLAGARRAASEARQRVFALRSGLAGGTITLTQVLEHPVPDAPVVAQAQRLQIARVLTWTAGIGERIVARILDEVDVRSTTRVVELSRHDRERILIAARTLTRERHYRLVPDGQEATDER